jgi:hypothetical protein
MAHAMMHRLLLLLYQNVEEALVLLQDDIS